MKNRKWLWVVGIGLALLIVCVGSIGFTVLAMRGATSAGNLAVGEGIALIKVEGAITGGDPPTDLFGSSAAGAYSGRIVRQLKRAEEDGDVKAIVLRVDSPGGGVVASDEIYAQILEMEKPILVSMGTLAASGGYYISAPTTEIWANRHTLTGSIGVIVQFINAEELIDKYGIDVTTIKTGSNKDTGSLFRNMTEEEIAIWQEIATESYDVFVQIVADGRGLDEAKVRELADGRVYTGMQALELGLVDNLGNLDDVIDRAAELTGLGDEPRIIEYDQVPSPFGGLFGAFNRPSPVEEVRDLLQLNAAPVPMYLYTGE